MQPRFFRTAAAFRRWLRTHHALQRELRVGFRKKATSTPSLTWPESVDEALCFGWIDGLRRALDENAYTVRFTPRRSGSIWSAVNVRRVQALTEAGRMAPAGLAAFEARRENRSGGYSYEQRPAKLPAPYAGMLAARPGARRFFEDQAPSYRRAAIWWVISAKQEQTCLRRARTLAELSARGERIPQCLPRRSAAG
jgi:uncharacterized protein YdeI (YjbR/CyaY-like superfamily)